MILINLEDRERLRNLNPFIYEALTWAATHIDERFEKGSVLICDGKVKVNKEEVAMMPAEKKMLEAHRHLLPTFASLRKILLEGTIYL